MKPHTPLNPIKEAHCCCCLHTQIDGNRPMETVFNDIVAIMDKAVAAKDPLENFCQQVPEADECRVYSE
jgi:hypothetical protein